MFKGHQDALRVTAEEFNVTVQSILMVGRTASVARARHGVCLVLKSHFKLSSVEIGRIMKRNHTTVLNSLGQSRWLMAQDNDFRAAVACTLSRLEHNRLAPCSPLDTLLGSCYSEASDCTAGTANDSVQ